MPSASEELIAIFSTGSLFCLEREEDADVPSVDSKLDAEDFLRIPSRLLIGVESL